MKKEGLIGMATAAAILAGCGDDNSGLNGDQMIDCTNGPKQKLFVEPYAIEHYGYNIEGTEFVVRHGKLIVNPHHESFSLPYASTDAELATELHGVTIEKNGDYSLSKGPNNERKYTLHASKGMKPDTIKVEIYASCQTPEATKPQENK